VPDFLLVTRHEKTRGRWALVAEISWDCGNSWSKNPPTTNDHWSCHSVCQNFVAYGANLPNKDILQKKFCQQNNDLSKVRVLPSLLVERSVHY
jgi:hypothetical protein